MPVTRLCDLVERLAVPVTGDRSSTVEILDLTEDSRAVSPGFLFIARRGTQTHGGQFVADAAARGAGAILTDEATPTPVGTPTIRARDVAKAAGEIAELFFGEPSKKMKLVGVTGSNGKTTTAHLIQQILTLDGDRCGLMGTVFVDDGVDRRGANLTTPGAIEISRSLARMVDNDCRWCVMEASSHALDQRRVEALSFDAAVFTNLSGDHLDYHGTMEAYAAVKARLFANLRDGAVAVVNMDDEQSGRMIIGFGGRVIRCSLANELADATAHSSGASLDGCAVTLRGPWGEIKGRTRLVGEHNLMNVLEALCAAHAVGAEIGSRGGRLEELAPPPGRLEVVQIAGSDALPTVLVDYAHTDDALARALSAVRPMVSTGGLLWVVFGCGGDRDESKRPRMGAVAAVGADRVVVTSDNPRTQDSQRIIDAIVAGMPRRTCALAHVDADRRRAINFTLEQASEDDIVLIAGKGHENYQIVSDGKGGSKKIDFDDRLVATEALQRRAGAGAVAR